MQVATINNITINFASVAVVFTEEANDNKRRPIALKGQLVATSVEGLSAVVIAEKVLKVSKSEMAAAKAKIEKALEAARDEVAKTVTVIAPVAEPAKVADTSTGTAVKQYRVAKPTTNNSELVVSIIRKAGYEAEAAGQTLATTHVSSVLNAYAAEHNLMPRRINGIKGYLATRGFTL